MSVSRFPNATTIKEDELETLVNKLLTPLDPALEADVYFMKAAYFCALVEQLLAMQKLPLYQKLDPVILSQIKSVLDSCR
ncbi:MAG: hypothetical protein UY04_C0040G0010 [Parcubacteria group bacterium GW2011_GWA2_47_7]|nr:MAG: hypothetical protein UY04_C0040G0010 [Parcubacteria group bacterium GW2011_GWA2_47_7]